MPELPEVEVIRRDLEQEVVGRTIVAARVGEAANARRVIRRHSSSGELEAPVSGALIGAVARRGKYLLVGLGVGGAGADLVLVVHLGMSGQLLRAPADAPMRPHTHVVFDLDDGSQLRYVDPRAFGQMFVTTPAVPELAHVGLDPLDARLTASRFAHLLSGHHVALKALLMNQRLVSGIGNIYSDEMLFRARLHPFRLSDGLTGPETRRLYRAMPEVLTAAIANRGTSAADAQYRDLYGSVGQHSHALEVYQREGKECRRCGSAIQRARWTNRSTHYCPKCQVQ